MDLQNAFLPTQGDGSEIMVVVYDPHQKKSGLSTYTVYKLKGRDKQGEFQAEKRYSDFDAIRPILVARWPGCFIPPLPRKKVIGNAETHFVEFRRQGLQTFCKQMAKLTHLWYSKEFQLFTRSTGDIEKHVKLLPNEHHEDIIKKYDQVFPKLRGKETDTIILAKVLQFGAYLKKNLAIIGNFKVMIEEFLQAKDNYFEQNSLLFNYILPEYEKSCLAIYCNQLTEGKFMFNEPNDKKLTELINSLKALFKQQNFEQFYKNLELEERETEAFLELYKSKESYDGKLRDAKVKEKDLQVEQVKLNAGKLNVFKSLLNGNLEQNKKLTARDIEANKDDIKVFSFICDLITLLLGYFQIDRFQKNKINSYFATIRKIAQFQIELADLRSQIYEHVLENHNLM